MVSTMPPQLDLPVLHSNGYELDPDHLGLMRDSSDLLDDTEGLRDRMREEGYLLLRGYLDRNLTMDARRVLTGRMMREGLLEPGTDPMEAIPSKAKKPGWYPDVVKDNEPLHQLLRAGRMMTLWDRFLGGPSFCFDYTWFRTVAPGPGTNPHCDVVYMGRGTRNLFTAWTPIGSVDFTTGGLIILEGSNRHQRLRETYGEMDVDTFCTNRPPESKSAKGQWAKTGGALGKNVNRVRKSIGGRWMTAEFDPGDLLIFTINTIHASLDNRSKSFRFSSDTRYQLESDPKDERWIGENPIAHGEAGKRGLIC